mmetsp:Transcript_20809/g.37345  ORF Transcript_20809/g.37345 Transcript_20809/m.37345 type:complete len:248 (-) Transcript_20809:21-764(-)
MFLLFLIIINPVQMRNIRRRLIVPQNLQPIRQTLFIHIETKHVHASSLHRLCLFPMRIKSILARTLRVHIVPARARAAPLDAVRFRRFLDGLFDDGRGFLSIEKVENVEDTGFEGDYFQPNRQVLWHFDMRQFEYFSDVFGCEDEVAAHLDGVEVQFSSSPLGNFVGAASAIDVAFLFRTLSGNGSIPRQLDQLFQTRHPQTLPRVKMTRPRTDFRHPAIFFEIQLDCGPVHSHVTVFDHGGQCHAL